MNLLCLLGIHKWEQVGLGSLVMPVFIDQCQRCECGRANGGYYTESYTAEQMRAAIAASQGQEGGTNG